MNVKTSEASASIKPSFLHHFGQSRSSAINIPFLKGQVCSTAINCQCFLSVCILDVRTQLFIAEYSKADPPEAVQFAAWIPSPQVSQHRWLLTLVLVLVLPPLQGSVWHLAKGPRGRAWKGHYPSLPVTSQHPTRGSGAMVQWIRSFFFKCLSLVMSCDVYVWVYVWV